MQPATPRVTLKQSVYLIVDPVRDLYARIKGPAPANPQPAEDNLEAVAARPSHIEFGPWQLATMFRSYDDALQAFARSIGVAPLEIVRREP